MIALLNKTAQKQYFNFFRWGYLFSAGYFTLYEFNKPFFNENLWAIS